MTHEETAHALGHVRPNALWNLSGTQLEWLDQKQSEPSQEELDAACHKCNPLQNLLALASTDTEKLNAVITYLGVK